MHSYIRLTIISTLLLSSCGVSTQHNEKEKTSLTTARGMNNSYAVDSPEYSARVTVSAGKRYRFSYATLADAELGLVIYNETTDQTVVHFTNYKNANRTAIRYYFTPVVDKNMTYVVTGFMKGSWWNSNNGYKYPWEQERIFIDGQTAWFMEHRFDNNKSSYVAWAEQ